MNLSLPRCEVCDHSLRVIVWPKTQRRDLECAHCRIIEEAR